MPSPVILVAGTHGLHGLALLEEPSDPEVLPWWHPQSTFGLEAAGHGVTLIDAAEPFLGWSSSLDGLMGDNVTWYAGGQALRYFAHAKHPPVDGQWRPVSVVAHSHGGQVALYACAQGLIVDVLITVGTPVRADMEAVAERARPNITRWVHLYSDVDVWQAAGGVGDGHLGVMRTFPQATANVLEPRVSHSELLMPSRWTERDWWGLLGAVVPQS